jgi:hypothetical protein
MTPDEFTRRLPILTENPLPIQPPFVFNGMSARVFPLRAHLDTLQRVCDGFLNFVPPQAGYFRAPMPYVFMMVLDYGQVAEAVARVGWFAQVEVFFMIPVEWYRLVGGKWVFHDWAVVTPYVFVDDDFSVPLGRTVYGFPKVLAKIMQTPSAWIKDTSAPVTLAQIETNVFPQAYVGADMESRVFLEIERGTASGLQMPLDPTAAMMPWTIASNLATAFAGFGRDASWMAQAMRISSVNPFADPGVFQEMLRRMLPWFAPGGAGFVQNSLNLKQFRRSNDPADICYQALTNGCMETKAFNGGGLLGEYATMLGDLSGGHSIKLYDYPSLPIVRTLGLEVNRQWQGPEGNVNELKPVMPFWIDVDLKYDSGVNLAWRTSNGVWKDPCGVEFDPQPSATDAEEPKFNSTVTTAIDEIAGPFEFSDATVRVLPLLAKRAKLQKYLDQYINTPLRDPIKDENGKKAHLRFNVWARRPPDDLPNGAAGQDLAYVYLIVSSFGSVTSLTNNVGNWTKYQLSFMIPVEFQRMNNSGNWEIAGVGLISALSFVDNCIAAIARQEVQGFEATVANFSRPESVWLSDEGEFSANPEQTLLRVDAEVWSALGQGQKATIQPIIEISEGVPDAGLGDAPDPSWRWAESLRSELLAKKLTKAQDPVDLQIGRALALELLGNQMPFTAYSLKQFRDVADPARACYQSLVRVPRLIKELFDLREIEETLVVQIHDYPSLDIVDQLGLVATRLPDSSSGIVSTVQAVRPFYVQATLYEPLAEPLAWRAGGSDWALNNKVAFATPLCDEDYAPPITADYKAERLQDQMDPCHMSALMFQAAQRRGFSDEERNRQQAPAISKAAARRALGNIDAQTVIESVLSREWGNADPNTRWRAGRRELIKTFSALPLSGETSAFAESVLYRQINNQLASAPGSVASSIVNENQYTKDLAAAIARLSRIKPLTTSERWRTQIEKIILTQEKFMRLRLAMENDVNQLAATAILKLPELRISYKKLGEKVPSPADLVKLTLDLVHALRTISEQTIEGEPSERNNLDARVRADQQRLKDLLNELPYDFTLRRPQREVMKRSQQFLGWATQHVEEFRHLVELARGFCEAQNDALLNKLSRAYQKPDYCIRRDSVGSTCDLLLPLSLSWNADWYYGRELEYALPTLPKLRQAARSGGKR